MPYTSLSEAVQAVHDGEAVLVDVRTYEEHEQQAAHKSVHLDVSDIQAGSNPDIPKDSIVLMYCRSGGRAGTACSILSSRGYKNVLNVGGLSQWLAAGGTTKE